MRVNAQTEGWRPLYVNPSPLRSLGRRGVVIAIVPPFVRSVVDGHRLVGPEEAEEEERENGGKRGRRSLVRPRRPAAAINVGNGSIAERERWAENEGRSERTPKWPRRSASVSQKWSKSSIFNPA